MKEHPLNEILKTSMVNLGEMIDVSKVVGTPIMLPNDTLAIPLSKVVCGFGVGGSEIPKKGDIKTEFSEEIFPFGGGSGGGISIIPSALLVLSEGKIKLLKVEKNFEIVDKVVDTFNEMIKK